MKIFTLGGFILPLAIVFVAASPGSLRAQGGDNSSSTSSKEAAAAEVVASRVRDQGYRCDKPKTAERDVASSQPDRAVWVLECENASYRITLIPHRAALVERVGSR